MSVMKAPLLALSRSERVKHAALRFGPARSVVRRFVPGETIEDALGAVRTLAASGLLATIDHLGEFATSSEVADSHTATYVELLRRLASEGLADVAEVSVKASALGTTLPGGAALAEANARLICAAAREAGTTVTLDAEDHPTTDATLALLDALRADFPETGGVLQAMLRRTPADCERLATPGSRIRLCKGAYDEPPAVAHTRPSDVRDAFLACLRVLLRGEGHPMIATHDPAMIHAALGYLDVIGREPGTYEFQMLHGIRPDEQRRLADAGHRVRVYVPFGADWYAYFMRRLAEKPANLALLGRALVTRG